DQHLGDRGRDRAVCSPILGVIRRRDQWLPVTDAGSISVTGGQRTRVWFGRWVHRVSWAVQCQSHPTHKSRFPGRATRLASRLVQDVAQALNGAEVVELVWVDDRADRRHPAVDDLE